MLSGSLTVCGDISHTAVPDTLGVGIIIDTTNDPITFTVPPGAPVGDFTLTISAALADYPSVNLNHEIVITVTDICNTQSFSVSHQAIPDIEYTLSRSDSLFLEHDAFTFGSLVD